MRSLKELINNAQDRPNRTVALACPEDHEVLLSVFAARKLNLCDFILFGNESKILEIVEEMKEELDSGISIVNVEDNQLACAEAVKAVSNNQANVLMKGLVDTSVILKEVLNKEYGLRTNMILSHVMLCELPKFDRLIFLTDGAMNIDPDSNQLKQITINAIDLARSLGIKKPKVAMLSAVEKVNPKMPSTLKCKDIVDLFEQGEITNCELAGPLALDLALDEEAVKTKNIENPVAGHADILVAPFIEVANVLYKGWMFGCENTKSAGIIVGAKAPIVLTSRADSHESKLYSLALSVLMDKEEKA